MGGENHRDRSDGKIKDKPRSVTREKARGDQRAALEQEGGTKDGKWKRHVGHEFGDCRELLRPSWCPHPHASLIEEITERVRLSPAKNEDLRNLNVVHKIILPQQKESEETTGKQEKLVKKMEPGGLVTSRRRRKVRCR